MGNNLNPTPLLFNDVYFSRWEEPTAPSPSIWAPFPRLPAELRLRIWLLSLQQHRMIEVDLHPTTGDDDAPQYADSNHLGRIISGRSRSYTSRLRGRGSYAASLTSLTLLRVSCEARAAALSFYHIHLPLGTGQVLYLSSEYDVIYVRPRRPKPINRPPETDPDPEFGTILVDFLHDARAYDYKDQGVSHLVLDKEIRHYLLGWFEECVNLTPEMLHPAAATSFADILRYKLRSLLCVVDFGRSTRGMGAPPLGGGWRSHFAQTFPLRRRGHVTGAFHWLQADPRPGVDLDLRQLPIKDDPHLMLRNWRRLEHLFGVTRNQQANRENNDDCGFCLYVCPTKNWSTLDMHRIGGAGMRWATRWNVQEMEAEAEAVWSRDELAQYLQYEAEDWDEQRWYLTRVFGGTHQSPKYSSDSREEAEIFEAMEQLPCTAIGMWLFPAKAFPPPTIPQLLSFNLSAVRPSLLLFEV
ncbi:uncharacterized protein B0H64DRAFT_327382 [Chaetomium fimeti]|uniref:2EXR domain-containing protein n=1 Tax=Chaetomium fimeti TaxID=1854472 RepID=A0AAE0HBW7_9PEZI|nr:hypothetical protein B0H64DRAFT_327382 [Chaetomium fimeti]